MNLGTVRIVNSQAVFSNPKDNNVNFIIGDRSLQLASSSSTSSFSSTLLGSPISSSITIPYTSIDNIIIDKNVFTINLNRTIDTQLGSTSFLNILTHNQQQVFTYIQALGKKNPKITVHSINDFSPEVTEEDIVDSMLDLSISSDYYGRIDSDPSSVLNCNVYVTLTVNNIYFHNRRGYGFELPYANISQIDVFATGLYLHIREQIYPFNNQAQSTLVIYTSEPNSLFVSIKAHIK